MATKKKTSKLSRLNVFANSPLVVKLFGAFIVVLMIAAIGYGGYTLLGINDSNAAKKSSSKYGSWYYNSKGITHQGGQAATWPSSGCLQTVLLGNCPKNKRIKSVSVWKSSIFDGGKYIWAGGSKHFKSGLQYLGCFIYRADAPISEITGPTGNTKAYLQIVDHAGTSKEKVLRQYYADESTPKSYKFARTCLAFNTPRSAKDNKISLRVKIHSIGIGPFYVRKTLVVQVPKKNTKLPKLWILNKSWPDNKSVINNYGYL